MFCPKLIKLKPAFFDIVCFFGRIFLEKTQFFAFFAALLHFSSAKIVFLPLLGCLPCLLPIKTRCFFAYCDPPSHPFSSKNLFSAHVPRGSQKAPRNFAEGAQKASRKHPEKFPEGSQKASRTLPEGSQEAPRRSNRAPRRFAEGSQTLPQGSQKSSQKGS